MTSNYTIQGVLGEERPLLSKGFIKKKNNKWSGFYLGYAFDMSNSKILKKRKTRVIESSVLNQQTKLDLFISLFPRSTSFKSNV